MSHRPTRSLARPLFQRAWLAPSYWRRWLQVAGCWWLQYLPSAARLAIGRWWGRFRYRRDHGARIDLERRLQFCLRKSTAEQRAWITRRHFEQQAHMLLDRGLLWWGSADTWRRRVRVAGAEHLRPLMEAGRPVVLFTFPHTAQAFAEIALHRHFLTALSLVDRGRDGLEDRLALRARLRSGGLFLEGTGLMQVMRLVKDGHLLLHRGDDAADPPLFAPFFGASAATSTSVARIARLCGAAVVPYMAYHRQGHYEVRLFPPLEMGPGREEARNAARLSAALERMIARAPEQFLWREVRLQGRAEGAAPGHGRTTARPATAQPVRRAHRPHAAPPPPSRRLRAVLPEAGGEGHAPAPPE